MKSGRPPFLRANRTRRHEHTKSPCKNKAGKKETSEIKRKVNTARQLRATRRKRGEDGRRRFPPLTPFFQIPVPNKKKGKRKQKHAARASRRGGGRNKVASLRIDFPLNSSPFYCPGKKGGAPTFAPTAMLFAARAYFFRFFYRPSACRRCSEKERCSGSV